MLTLRRLLLVVLLMGLVLGCKAKTPPVGAEETPSEHRDKKIKALEHAPEGPPLR